MYPEVHTLTGANLHWSGIETQGFPNVTQAHRNLLEPFHQDERPDHYGTLDDGHRTRTILEQSPQLNWRLPRIGTKAPQSLGRSPQLNWRSPRNCHGGTTKLRKISTT
jgi:hypothetical protein